MYSDTYITFDNDLFILTYKCDYTVQRDQSHYFKFMVTILSFKKLYFLIMKSLVYFRGIYKSHMSLNWY